MANQKYTSIKNDFCIVFDRTSEIVETDDDMGIKNQGFHFATIDEINLFEQMRTIDTIGVITQVGILGQFKPKNGGPSRDKKTLCIADDSGLSIQLTLWGGHALNDKLKEGQILAVRGARVSDYGGKSLNAGDENSKIYINIDHKRTEQLRKWYDENPEHR